jgi:3-phenylpropionate/cinnamic acid dioxygenase small subunit
MLSEPVIKVDDDTARAATDYTFISRANTILSTGRYFDAMRRTPDGWCFASREIVFSGDTPVGIDG